MLLGAIGTLAAVVIAVLLSIPLRSETIKERVVALLSDQLESEVTIDRLEGRLFPRVGVSGGGVVIRHKGRTDVPPLITIEQFEIRGSLRDLMRRPRRVSEVRLQGLQVKIPLAMTTDGPADASGTSRVEQARRLRTGDHRSVRGSRHGDHADSQARRQAAKSVHGSSPRDGPRSASIRRCRTSPR